MNELYSRRQVFQHTAQLSATGLLGPHARVTARGPGGSNGGTRRAPIRYCLNTSTIRGQKKTVGPKKSIWWRPPATTPLNRGSAKSRRTSKADNRCVICELRSPIEGLSVESAIGFAQWIVDDDAQRAAALEALKRDMDLVRQIGGTRIAAPPAGATQQADLNLDRAAERYARMLELGREMGCHSAVGSLGILAIAQPSGRSTRTWPLRPDTKTPACCPTSIICSRADPISAAWP